ncbi:Sugar phosphate isomerase/epimerase [Lachnospiraceae bacterium A10]|nr:Sugar phosphate isomerase/epimerase [Lachnospiraceae bacterium A10]
MLEIGVQTHNAVMDENPEAGFQMMRDAGFTCADFSLNMYLKNTDLYKERLNGFFDQSIEELEQFFTPHKEAAKSAGVRIHQMHMPYPNFIPSAADSINDYLLREMAPKSMQICKFFDCKYIVVHGLKVKHFYGTEEAEWEATEKFLDRIFPMAKEMGITICVENIYTSAGKHILEGPCCDARKMAERIDRINEKYGAEVLGFCFDTGHANLVGIDFEKFILTLGKRLKVLHIHDNDGIADLHQVPFTFTRTRENNPSTDWEGFVRALRAIDYDGVLNFETAPVLRSFPEGLRPQALRMLAEIGQYFAREISGQ